LRHPLMRETGPDGNLSFGTAVPVRAGRRGL